MASQEHGQLRLIAKNAEETQSVVLWRGTTYDFRIENVAGTEYYKNYDARKQPQIPTHPHSLMPDDKLYLEFMADAADTIESEESLIIVPIQTWSRGDKKAYPRTLKGEDFEDSAGTSFGQSDTTDIACAAGSWQTIGYYTVPKQTQLRVGNMNPTLGRLYCYIGDDT